jgi:hypothetical protein
VIHFIHMLVSGIVLVYKLVARAVCDSLYSNVGFWYCFSVQSTVARAVCDSLYSYVCFWYCFSVQAGSKSCL